MGIFVNYLFHVDWHLFYERCDKKNKLLKNSRKSLGRQSSQVLEKAQDLPKARKDVQFNLPQIVMDGIISVDFYISKHEEFTYRIQKNIIGSCLEIFVRGMNRKFIKIGVQVNRHKKKVKKLRERVDLKQ